MADYTAYLVRIWYQTDLQRLRITVQDAYSGKRYTFTDFARLNDFLNRNSAELPDQIVQSRPSNSGEHYETPFD